MLYAPQLEKSALEALPQKENDKNKNEYYEKEKRKCDYYWKIEHTKDKCWKLHVRPPRGLGRKGGTARSQAHFSDLTDSDATTSDCVTKRLFTIQNIKGMMMQLEASENQNKPSSASVHSGITANSSGISYLNSWIIDSGVTCHMTGFIIFFPLIPLAQVGKRFE